MADRRSAEAAEYRKLYKTVRWQRLRQWHLSQHPLCVFCLRTEDVTEAAVVDHVRKHSGDEALFFDPDNLQSLCKHHHDSAKQMIERGKQISTYDLDGYPIDLN